jgi:hypothetical protein
MAADTFGVEFVIVPDGGEDGPVLGFEPANDDAIDRFDVSVDGRLAGIVDQVDDCWLLRDVGQIGFGSMSFARELDEHALADAVLDALGDWIDDHRPDLYRPI